MSGVVSCLALAWLVDLHVDTILPSFISAYVDCFLKSKMDLE